MSWLEGQQAKETKTNSVSRLSVVEMYDPDPGASRIN